MMGLPLAFAAPAVLGALILLPAIWWLLRLTPPRPRVEAFPPLRLLLEIARKEETPAKSPWWLTLLRLLLAALVIIALAGPILRPIAEEAPGDGPLLLVLDNGWASARQWDSEVETARRILGIAARAERPVSLVATAEGTGQPLAPTDADSALRRLEAIAPQPVPAQREALAAALAEIVEISSFGGVVWLSDGLGGPDADAFAAFLSANAPAPVLIYQNGRTDLIGMTPPGATADSLVATIVRQAGAPSSAGLVRALDIQGRLIGEATYDFGIGQSPTADAEITLPTELRNDIARLEIAGEETAGAVQLLDDRFKRRRIGLLSGASADTAQPLLSPLYYISRAVEPFADIRESRDANLAVALPELIDAGSSVIAMADVGTLTPEVEEAVVAWMEDGGTLLRFAGPRLAATPQALAPVILREGDRVLGGSLSWETPQLLGGFSEASPFRGLPVPDDVVVQRQVLAEPDADLADRTWAYLADGTPLVTAAQRGEGWLILFHVTADPAWSNLPLSGTFVEMLRRVVAFSNSVRVTTDDGEGSAALLPPYRMLDGFGRFTGANSDAEPIPANAPEAPATPSRPPGLYGSEEGFRAVNLLGEDATLPAFDPGPLGAGALRAYPTEAPEDLAPPLLAIALLLLLLDAIAVLWLAGVFSRRRRAITAALAFLLLVPAAALSPREASAQPAPDASLPAAPDPAADEFALKAANGSFLAYVITGNAVLDRTSEAGMSGLAQVVAGRTAFEPEGPIGVNIETDDLSFFPIIYWPIDPAAPLPSAATMARVDAFMKEGGTILFDTRDQLERSIGNNSFSGTPSAERLQAMLASLDIPPLEPVPADHVLTKTFYILNEFTGRYSGSPLWVEATAPVDPNSGRPVRPGDGVTSIMITGADLAAAWAVDDRGQFLYPTVPVDSFYREMAFRSGINILMYALTGNYKADQVHIPAILERLGQ
ncbi:MAG: DUF4159 domain-containing protein [Bauldia sp.]|nr:DUF4159 domain-containing protein [Bauldia sp.]